MVGGRLLFYWEGNFSGAMLNFGRVLALDFPGDEKTWDIFIVFLWLVPYQSVVKAKSSVKKRLAHGLVAFF